MRKHLPQIMLVLVLAAFILVGWQIDARRAEDRSVLSGFFETTPTEVSSRVEGRVQTIFVREGDPVKKGQILISLESGPEIDSARAKQADARQALAALREIEAGPRPEDIARQEAAVAAAQANLDLLLAGPRREDIAQARSRLAQMDAAYRKALAGPRPQEVAEARAAAGAAWAHYAQARRGLTPEEIAEAKARLDSARARDSVAKADADRYARLYAEDAVTAQQNDQEQANLLSADADENENQQAYQRAVEGTPKEELAEAWQAYKQAKSALDLVLAGSRQEDIAQAAAQRAQAQEALVELLHGSRPEDIRAGRARLAQETAYLNELEAGSRPEDIDQAKAAARAALQAARSADDAVVERTIRAPQDDVVQDIPVAVGDLVPAGAAVVRLVNRTDLWIRVYVPEAALSRLAAGDSAEIRVDGIPGTLPGNVENIASEGEFTPANLQSPDERGKQAFAVRLRLSSPDPRVKAGMYATVVRIANWTP
jgi:multidrug resistance efflux pump